MARQNQWQSFAQNFTGVYDAVNKGARGIEMGIASKADYNDPNGVALKGEALGLAKNQRLADIEAKYGDPTAGQTLLSTAADARAKTFTNNLNTEIRPDLVYQKGKGATDELKSNIAKNNASAANSSSLASHRNAMSPLQVAEQGIKNDEAALKYSINVETRGDEVNRLRGVANQAFGLGESALAKGEVDKNSIRADSIKRLADSNKAVTGADSADLQYNEDVATSDARVAGIVAGSEESKIQAQLKALELAENIATSDSRTGLTNSNANLVIQQNMTETQKIEAQATDKNIQADLFANHLKEDYPSIQAADNAMIQKIFDAEGMSVEGKQAAMAMVQEFGIARIGAQAAETTELARQAFRDNGLQGLADMYDSIDDGVDGKVVVNEDGSKSVVVDRGDGNIQVIATASGKDADQLLTTQVMEILNDPMKSMEMAAEKLAYNKKSSDVDLTDSQVSEAISRTNLNKEELANIQTVYDLKEAQIAQIQVQIEKVSQDIFNENLKRPLTEREFNEQMDDRFNAVLVDALGYEPDMSPEQVSELRTSFEAGYVDFENISHTPN